MKIRILILSICVLCFGSSFCSAKQNNLNTPAVFVAQNDTITCNLSNLTESSITVDLRIVDANGNITSETASLLDGNETASITFVSTSNTYRCSFLGIKSTKARAAMVLTGTTSPSPVVVPAN